MLWYAPPRKSNKLEYLSIGAIIILALAFFSVFYWNINEPEPIAHDLSNTVHQFLGGLRANTLRLEEAVPMLEELQDIDLEVVVQEDIEPTVFTPRKLTPSVNIEGRWEDRIFVSEQLGLMFSAPSYWYIDYSRNRMTINGVEWDEAILPFFIEFPLYSAEQLIVPPGGIKMPCGLHYHYNEGATIHVQYTYANKLMSARSDCGIGVYIIVAQLLETVTAEEYVQGFYAAAQESIFGEDTEAVFSSMDKWGYAWQYVILTNTTFSGYSRSYFVTILHEQAVILAINEELNENHTKTVNTVFDYNFSVF